jgi:hypothetical protein
LEISLGVRGANTKVFLLLLHRFIEPFGFFFGLLAIPSSVLSVVLTITPAALSLAVLAAFFPLSTSVLSLSPAAILLIAIATLALVVAVAIAPSEFRKTVVRILRIIGVALHFGLTQSCPVAAAIFLASRLAVPGLLAVAKSAGTCTVSIFSARYSLSGGVGTRKSAA